MRSFVCGAICIFCIMRYGPGHETVLEFAVNSGFIETLNYASIIIFIFAAIIVIPLFVGLAISELIDEYNKYKNRA